MCDTTHIAMVIPSNRNAAWAVKYSRKHMTCTVLLLLKWYCYMNFSGCTDWLEYSLVGKYRRPVLSFHGVIYILCKQQ